MKTYRLVLNLFLLSLFLILTGKTKAQDFSVLFANNKKKTYSMDLNRNLGIGLQTTALNYGISLKYGVSENLAIQGVIAPFSVSVLGTSVSLNYYGARFIYRFPGDDHNNVVVDPYLFVGGGVISLSSNGSEVSGNILESYLAGGGIELIFARKIALSLDVSYGKQSILGIIGIYATYINGGLHFYFN